jgi:hypothetical protein
MEFDIILNGQDEFYKNVNNKTYNILKVDNIQKENFMCTIFKEFINNLKNNPNEKHYIGIDFEFKQVAKVDKEVALMQINLENDSNIGYIFVLYPPSLTKDNYNLLITLISIPEIIKILHGAESLDIPYLFNQVLITKKNVNGFCNNFYDTRYLCEYYQKENNIKSKCSKLIPHLYEHKNYCIHYRNLKFIKKLGVEIGTVHNVVSFIQEPWMKPYIEFNTNKKKDAKMKSKKIFSN